MVTTVMQAAASNNVPQLLVLQILQLLVDWQNPSDFAWHRTLEEITRQCPLQKVEFQQLAKQCGRMSTDESVFEEISKNLEQINLKFSTSSKTNQAKDTTRISSKQYMNVNLGEALTEKTDMLQELRMKIKDLEIKQLTEMESRLEYETELIQRIQEQQTQLENLRTLIENSRNIDSDKFVILSNINKQQTRINSLKTDAECSRRTSLLSETVMTNFIIIGDRLIALERSQVQQQRTLASFKFRQQDQDDLVNENEKLKDEVEMLEDELRSSSMEASNLRDELKSKTEAIDLLNVTLKNIKKEVEEERNSEKPISTNQIRNLSLLEAVKFGDADAVSNMLDDGMYPNDRDDADWTLLHRAVEKGNLMIVKILVEHGADMYAHINSHSGDLPVHTAAVNNEIQIINYFIANGVPADVRNYLGTTPLLAAIWDGQIDAARFLTEFCNANINAQIYDLDNRTGLHLSALYGYEVIAEYLVGRKADTELRTSGNCSTHDQDHVSDYNNEHCDNMSETPLHWAARYDNWNVGKILVDNGANIYAKDGLGRTPQEVARYYGHLRFAASLGEETEPSQNDM